MVRRAGWLVLGLVFLGLVGQPGQGQQKKKLEGADAIRYYLNRNEHAKAEEFANQTLFPNIHQPEVLDLLSRVLETQKKREESAVMACWLLRVLDQATPQEVTKYKAATVKRLATLNKDFEAQKAKYAASAAGQKFASADNVDDLWMTQVQADLTSPHALYAYNLIGGRKYNDPEHSAIANQGSMHRSGLRQVDEIAGRQGVLFGVPMRADGPGLAKNKLSHPPQIRITNLAKGSTLRVGTKGFGFPYLLKVSIAGKEIASHTIGEKQWSDLKIDLGDQAGKPVEAILELVVPEGQKFSEGAWFDYIDFFAD